MALFCSKQTLTGKPCQHEGAWFVNGKRWCKLHRPHEPIAQSSESRELELLRAVEKAARGLKLGKIGNCVGRVNATDKDCRCGKVALDIALAA